MKRVAAGIENQPVSNVQWIERAKLRRNEYNPNRVAPPELKLLKISIVADGWTQPIVVRPVDNGEYEVVDGYHRWYISGADDEVAALTGGLVPCVIVEPGPEDQMMSTIRHNRARGVHAVLRMSDITRSLIDDQGYTFEQVGTLLGMETTETERLYDRGTMASRAEGREFGKGWVPAAHEAKE